MLVTFAKDARDGSTAADVIRVAAWALAEKFAGCSAEIVAQSSDGRSVTVSLGIAPGVHSVECLDWFTQQLADHSLTLVRDRHFERVIGQLDRTKA